MEGVLGGDLGSARAPRRIPIPVLVAPFAITMVAGRVADALWPTLVNESPAVLLALSSNNRYLLLTATKLGALAFFVIGFVRLIATDPLSYLLGRMHGEAALTWIERRTGSSQDGNSLVRRAERLFGRAAPVFIVVAPSAIWCLLAGAAKMRVSVFVACNVVGTVGRLALFWFFADAFESELETVLDAIQRFQLPLLVATVTLVIVQTMASRLRRRRATLETVAVVDPIELDAEAADAE